MNTSDIFAQAKAAHVVAPKIDRKVRDAARKVREDRYSEACSNGEENPERHLRADYVDVDALCR
jgi:hypothetical protein